MNVSEQLLEQKHTLQESLHMLDTLSLRSTSSIRFSPNGCDGESIDSEVRAQWQIKEGDAFHLDLSKCMDDQSRNETVELLENSFTGNLHPHHTADHEIRNFQSDEDAMMNFHQEILYAEFRDIIRSHPHGGKISVDSTKLRILLDLMRRQSFRLEQQVRYFIASVPDPNGTPSVSASASESASSQSEEPSDNRFAVQQDV